MRVAGRSPRTDCRSTAIAVPTLLLLASLVMPVAQSGASQARSHARVFILHSFGRDFGTAGEVTARFRTELARSSPAPVEFFEAYLETARFEEATNEAPLLGYLESLFASRPIDLFVASGGPAASFALRHRERLLASTPLLVTGVERRLLERMPESLAAASVTGEIDLPGSIRHILRLLPDTEHIVVVLGESPLATAWLRETERAFAPFADRIRFTWTHEWTLERTLRELAALPSRSAILFGMMHVDAAGIPYPAHTALDRIHEVANAPMFGFFEAEFGRGIVGGPLLSEAEAARLTAVAALRLLEGMDPREVERASVTAGAAIYDDRELQRWGIPEGRLPAGSTVMLRPIPVWTQYRVPILMTVGVVILQAALIGGLLMQRRRRRAAEQAARSFGRQLLTAHEDERRRLARELHDDLTQRLARLAIDAARVQAALAASTEQQRARAMREDLVRLSEDVHSLAYQLHPSVLDDLGLRQALEVECSRLSRTTSIDARLQDFTAPPSLPAPVGGCVFRVAQEALRNVARHARAGSVTVSVSNGDSGVQLVVRDDGAGFDTSRQAHPTGLGLISMRERAALIGGKVDIDSAPGKGTTVTLSIPPFEATS